MHPYHFHSFWLTMALSPFGLWVIAIVFVCFSGGLTRTKQVGTKVFYFKPVQWMIFGLLMSVSFVWVALIVQRPSDWFICVICGVAIWLFMWAGSPREMQVDLDKKTYRIITGWPLLTRQWEGPLNDVSELAIASGKYNKFLKVRWKTSNKHKRQPPKIVLGEFLSQRAAEAAAVTVMDEWSIVVPVDVSP